MISHLPSAAHPHLSAKPQGQTQLRCHLVLGGLPRPVAMLTSHPTISLLICLILPVQEAA